ncbi:DoxX family protein [Streptomyces sp. A7024]|uniref:DoxX family protein n=1 Tax=Streptomyces coryli TaxID=1128680 RepID=A0A6G4U7Y4_9ACTN|nr:DoxX family protein [Streptomyces coryli]NGN68112.1 DoxX family protein [Streptomyces coryli]
MSAAYVIVTAVTALVIAAAAYLDFVRHPYVLGIATRLRVPLSWTLPLGLLLATGALGLAAGFAVPWLGTAAATGLLLYFLGAIGAHLRVRDYDLGGAGFCLALATASLALGLAEHGVA